MIFEPIIDNFQNWNQISVISKKKNIDKMSAAIEVTQLPDDVREKLAELELELSEGEKALN